MASLKLTHRYEAKESPGDTLAATLMLATAIHAVVILGIGFSFTQPDGNRHTPSLDITMVADTAAIAPDDPDYLANANQDGSGDPDRQAPQPELLATESIPATVQESTPAEVLTARESSQRIQQQPNQPVAKQANISATQLMKRSLAMASLAGQETQRATSDADQQKHAYISPRTKEYMYANYMSGWVAKVERIGNLNYPDDARRRNLSGTLLLDVSLNPDGSIANIQLLRSSGHRALDDAAIRIVELAAPFAPFPADIRKETDILHITRTWEFLKSNRLHGG